MVQLQAVRDLASGNEMERAWFLADDNRSLMWTEKTKFLQSGEATSSRALTKGAKGLLRL